MREESDFIEVSNLPAVRERSSVLLAPVMDLNTAKKRLQEFQEFCAHYLMESADGGNDGGDYGVIPGTKKKTLFKSGADKLAELYGLSDEYVIKETIDWDRGLFNYDMTCVLKSRRDDSVIGSGVGCCSSFESKYRWRDAQKKCPKCGAEAIIKGKAEFGGGWLCWTKKSGCGAKFKDGDESIEKQITGRVENPDIIDIKNTVLKMAKKRAKIDAIIGVTRSSGLFTQDMDEIPVTQPLKEPETIKEPYTRTKPTAQPELPVEELLPTDTEYITMNQRKEFHRDFKKALAEHLKSEADTLLSSWLVGSGIFTEVAGVRKGTTAKIEAHLFDEVKARAIAYANKCL